MDEPRQIGRIPYIQSLPVPAKPAGGEWYVPSKQGGPSVKALKAAPYYMGDPNETVELLYMYKAASNNLLLREYPEHLSGTVENASELLKATIKHACGREPTTAVRVIAQVWEQAERVVSLAAARTRICLRRINLPVRFSDAIVAELEKFTNLNSDVSNSTAKLVSYTLDQFGARLGSPEFEELPNQSISVKWLLDPAEINWEVQRSELEWPGCRVRIMVLTPNGLTSTRILFNAFDVIEHLEGQLNVHGRIGPTSLSSSSTSIRSSPALNDRNLFQES